MTPLSRLKDGLKRRTIVRRAYDDLRHRYRRLLYRISPTWLARHRYRTQVGRRLPLDAPRTYDEKLFWLMLRWRHPLVSRCADKFGMRGYVEERGWGRILVPLYGVYESSAEIDFAALPGRFVLKCTHGCGFNILCPDKAALDQALVRRQLDSWMKVDFAKVYGEVQYAAIEPRIICEEFLEDGNGGVPADYKVHCFHGRAVFTTVCSRRDTEGVGALYDHYDRDWKRQLPISRSGIHPDRWVDAPCCYAEMLEAAEALSQPFPYVRMDFFCVGSRLVLGEMTFTPAGCIDVGYTAEAQQYLGGLIHLPEPLRG